MRHHIPMLLTWSRVAAIPLLAAAYTLDGAPGYWLPLLIFTYAAFTDFLDGYLARKWNAESDLGRLLDPVADKLLVATALIFLVDSGAANPFAVSLIILRELFISGLREWLGGRELSLPVSPLAKWKTAVQCVAIAALLAQWLMLGSWLLWAAALLSVITAAEYTVKAIRAINR